MALWTSLLRYAESHKCLRGPYDGRLTNLTYGQAATYGRDPATTLWSGPAALDPLLGECDEISDKCWKLRICALAAPRRLPSEC